MCGIFFCLFDDNKCCQKTLAEAFIDSVTPLIERRGPDCLRCKEKVVNDQFKLKVIGSVLHLRGSLTPQPLEDTQGNLLVWNGEVFGGIQVPDQVNDTSVLFHLLGKCSDSESVCHILNTMSGIQGPWAFMYYQHIENKLWFGRDYFGRRSLVWHLPRDDVQILAVSSLVQRSTVNNGRNQVWHEVPADGIYCLELKPNKNDFSHAVESFSFNSFKLKKYIWSSSNTEPNKDLYNLVTPVLPFNKQLPSESDLKTLDTYNDSVGLTSQNGLSKESFISSSKHLDYVPCGSSEMAKLTLNEVKDSCPKLSEVSSASVSTSVKDEQERTCAEGNVQSLKNLCNEVLGSSDNVFSLHQSIKWYNTPNEGKPHPLPNLFLGILGEAVRKRVFNLPRNLEEQKVKCENSTEEQTSGHVLTGKGHGEATMDAHNVRRFKCGRVGILFSGGIDSIVLAALADRFVPESEAIDLINVAFEQKQPKPNPTNKRKPRLHDAAETPPSFDVPDRITGRSGLVELAIINPKRRWNFIEVNVVLGDLQKARCEHITHLVSPLNSVLDDSIGCALWFAARGSGVLRCPSCVSGDGPCSRVHPVAYTSTAKVLLVGMGADEQLGGYARHRTKFNQQGWLGLVNEMEMEVNRISERNLGRDDRCISDHGREARFPFLDEQVVSFLSGLPVYLKADLRLPRGTGEKLLLRQSAKLLGLTSSAVLPKRAIQFGSRIAKLESSNEKGSDTCTRLKH